MVMAKALSLNDIVQYEIAPLFRRPHLTRKPKIGIFGLPGEGKSTLMAIIAYIDFMVANEPIWSNIVIKNTLDISDNIASTYGLKGGKVAHEARKLDFDKMYRMDKDYRFGGYAIDEININIADALKSTTNANFYFNQVDQQLRKDRNGLLYTSIHEMWVDYRVRDVTDIMIKCYDTALSPDGLAAEKQEGVDIEIWIYPMSRMLTGYTYGDTGEKLGPYYLHTKQWWGIFDTYQKQETGKKYARDVFKNSPSTLEVGKNQIAVEEYSKWGWLYDFIQGLREEGIKSITNYDLFDYLAPQLEHYTKSQIGQQLSSMGLVRRGQGTRENPAKYIIPDYDLNKPETVKTIKRVLSPVGR